MNKVEEPGVTVTDVTAPRLPEVVVVALVDAAASHDAATTNVKSATDLTNRMRTSVGVCINGLTIVSPES